jgi:hypothetical protein
MKLKSIQSESHLASNSPFEKRTGYLSVNKNPTQNTVYPVTTCHPFKIEGELKPANPSFNQTTTY